MTIPTARWRPLIATACYYTPPVPDDVLEAMTLVESGGDPNAHSASDARGLCQLIPRWHRDGVGKQVSELLGKPLTDALWYDPEFSLRCGALHLRYCFTSSGSTSWEIAIVKYFTGSATPDDGFEDGQGTSPNQHITKLRAALKLVREDRATTQETPTMTGMKPYRFLGLDKDVWLPDDIKVVIDIVPSSRANIRSNQRYTTQDRSVYHETGNQNPGANAKSERNWLHSGAGGASVGYNFAVDDTSIYQLTPLNEVTWHAGRAEWNKRSWGIEQCVGKGLDLDKARRNAASLHGGLAEACGWNPSVAIVQHNIVYGKACPAIIRAQGRWAAMQSAFIEWFGKATAARNGTDPVPSPDEEYKRRSPIAALQPFRAEDATVPFQVVDNDVTFTYAPYRVRAVKETPRYQYADTTGGVLDTPIPKGEEFDVMAVFTMPDGKRWFYSPWDTRVLADDVEIVGPVEREAA